MFVPKIQLADFKRPLLLLATLSASACHAVSKTARVLVLNDVHSRLNPTMVARVDAPTSTAELAAAIRAAKRDGQSVSISGGRHAMGGQQFGTATAHLGMSRMDDVLAFDRRVSECAADRSEPGMGDRPETDRGG